LPPCIRSFLCGRSGNTNGVLIGVVLRLPAIITISKICCGGNPSQEVCGSLKTSEMSLLTVWSMQPTFPEVGVKVIFPLREIMHTRFRKIKKMNTNSFMCRITKGMPLWFFRESDTPLVIDICMWEKFIQLQTTSQG